MKWNPYHSSGSFYLFEQKVCCHWHYCYSCWCCFCCCCYCCCSV